MITLEDEVKYLPKDISKYPVVRIIGKDKFCLYQIKLDDGMSFSFHPLPVTSPALPSPPAGVSPVAASPRECSADDDNWDTHHYH